MATTAAPMAAATEKAGWWTRFFAIVIDGLAIGIVYGLLVSILYQGDTTAGGDMPILLGVIYFCYFWSGYGKGRTLGMRALNVKVVKTDGSYLDLVGAFLRCIGLVISCLAIFIGVIWAAFDPQKQGWHDKIARTHVVKA